MSSTIPRPFDPVCEICGAHALIYLNGQRLLCWEHYCEAMRPLTYVPYYIELEPNYPNRPFIPWEPIH